MTAFPFRMGAGVAGDLVRSHPASVMPAAADSVSPPTEFGVALVVNPTTNGVRPVGLADRTTLPDATTGRVRVSGVLVRPYPYQQAAAVNYGAASFGAAVPAPNQPVDLCTLGTILVAIPVGQVPAKDGPVYIWATASTGAGNRANGDHVLGGFEAVASSGNTILMEPSVVFNGPPDGNGICELRYRV